MTTPSYHGTLLVHVHHGEHLMDVQTFGKQDPYVVMKVGKEKFKTHTCENGGTNPRWETSYCFNLDGRDDTLHFKIKDKEVGKDRDIGRADVPLSQIVHQNGRKGIPLVATYNFVKSAGTLWISTTFTAGGQKHKDKDHKHQAQYAVSSGYPGNAAAHMPVQQYPGTVYQQLPQTQVYPGAMYQQVPQQQAYAPQVYAPGQPQQYPTQPYAPTQAPQQYAGAPQYAVPQGQPQQQQPYAAPPTQYAPPPVYQQQPYAAPPQQQSYGAPPAQVYQQAPAPQQPYAAPQSYPPPASAPYPSAPSVNPGGYSGAYPRI